MNSLKIMEINDLMELIQYGNQGVLNLSADDFRRYLKECGVDLNKADYNKSGDGSADILKKALSDENDLAVIHLLINAAGFKKEEWLKKGRNSDVFEGKILSDLWDFIHKLHAKIESKKLSVNQPLLEPNGCFMGTRDSILDEFAVARKWVEVDAGDATAKANKILETVASSIIYEHNRELYMRDKPNKKKIPLKNLVRDALSCINSGNPVPDENTTKLVEGLITTIEAINNIRNGNMHGKVPLEPPTNIDSAALSVNAASILAFFLMDKHNRMLDRDKGNNQEK